MSQRKLRRNIQKAAMKERGETFKSLRKASKQKSEESRQLRSNTSKVTHSNSDYSNEEIWERYPGAAIFRRNIIVDNNGPGLVISGDSNIGAAGMAFGNVENVVLIDNVTSGSTKGLEIRGVNKAGVINHLSTNDSTGVRIRNSKAVTVLSSVSEVRQMKNESDDKGFEFEGNENINISKSRSIGHTKGFVVKNNKDVEFSNNESASSETVRISAEIEKLRLELEGINESKTNEIRELIEEIKENISDPDQNRGVLQNLYSKGNEIITLAAGTILGEQAPHIFTSLQAVLNHLSTFIR